MTIAEMEIQARADRDEIRRLKAKLAEARGESSVLVGCPCRCHTSFWDDPHLDCRECVRGTWIMAATLERVDADHDWALWHEKWIAALDLMGSQSDRATKAEAKLAEEQAEVERLREALEAVLTESGLQAHKYGCKDRLCRPAQWDEVRPCAGCRAEAALRGGVE